MGKIMYNDIDFSGADIVEITQADYDALPSTKYYDDITYLITDVYSPSSTKNVGLGECYSLSEKQIGCWTDGKPLYQKTIYIPSVIYDSDWHTVNHNISNLGTVVEVNGILRQPSYSYPIPAYRPQYNLGIAIEVHSTEIHYMNNWIAASTDMDITIKYTKTTDTAGSGNWTPEGVPAVHYSTNERLIGTWVDNNPLYQRCYVLTSGIVTGSNYGYIDLPSNIVVRDYDGMIYRNNHKNVDKFNGYISNGDIFCAIRTNRIEYKIASVFENIEELVFIVTYTKTS